MKERAVVLASDGQMVKISLRPHGGCSNCGRCASSNERIFLLEDNRLLNPGDVVEVEMTRHTLFFSAFLVYIFPLLGFFLGYLLGIFMANNFHLPRETSGIIFSLISLGLSLLVVRFLGERLDDKGVLTPRIVRVIRDEF